MPYKIPIAAYCPQLKFRVSVTSGGTLLSPRPIHRGKGEITLSWLLLSSRRRQIPFFFCMLPHSLHVFPLVNSRFLITNHLLSFQNHPTHLSLSDVYLATLLLRQSLPLLLNTATKSLRRHVPISWVFAFWLVECNHHYCCLEGCLFC